MSHTDFFDEVPGIVLYDPLAEFLGAAEDGLLHYGYSDAVRLAGHSCPTVAAAYGCTLTALRALYADATPVRGDIRVEFAQSREKGVTGVIANVVSMLTGAMAEDGFKGLAGNFGRNKRLNFSMELPAEMRFTRLDTGRSVSITFNPQRLPASPRLSGLMASCLDGSASPDEVVEFRRLWQQRVRSILLEHGDDPTVFIVMPS